MRSDSDHADRLLAFQRAEPLGDLALRRAEPDWFGNFNGNKVAVLSAAGSVGGNFQLAAELFLLDRLDAAAAVGCSVKDAKDALLRLLQHANDAAPIFEAVLAIR